MSIDDADDPETIAALKLKLATLEAALEEQANKPYNLLSRSSPIIQLPPDTEETLNKLITSARNVVNEIERLREDAQGAQIDIKARSGAAADLMQTMAGMKSSVEAQVNVTGESIEKAKAAESTLGELNRRAAELITKSEDLATKNADDTATVSKVKDKIEALLAGATSVGLAHAFDARKQAFATEANVWRLVFFLCVVGLAIWAGIGIAAADAEQTWSGFALHMAKRLPVTLPVIWIAIYSSTQAGLCVRMAEEYGFKATVSTSFEGYRQLFAGFPPDLAPTSPLARLSETTIGVIATAPGQVYRTTNMSPTPVGVASEALQPLVVAMAPVAAPVVAAAAVQGKPVERGT